MKKNKSVQVPRVSADKIAKNLSKGLGKDKAFKVARSMAKELSTIGAGDVNTDLFSGEDIRKNERIWTQVQNILGKK